MTAEELKSALETLGWSQAELARRMGVHANSASKWATGKVPVPGSVAAYLKLVLTLKEAIR